MKFAIGQIFNNIQILADEGCNYWKVLCLTCNESRVVQSFTVRHHAEKPRRCYCKRVQQFAQKKTTHGMCRTPIYSRWMGMMERCYRPKASGYERYGGRGIKVCERWHKFENFLADMGSSFTEDLTLDRKNPDKDYRKNNCRWIPMSEQAATRSKKKYWLGDRQYTAKELCGINGVELDTFLTRLDRGWVLKRAIEPPKWSRKNAHCHQAVS